MLITNFSLKITKFSSARDHRKRWFNFRWEEWMAASSPVAPVEFVSDPVDGDSPHAVDRVVDNDLPVGAVDGDPVNGAGGGVMVVDPVR